MSLDHARWPKRTASRSLSLPGDWIALLEGPEKAAAVHAVMGWRTDTSLSSGSLPKPHYPAGTRLVIFGDNGSGRAEAENAAKVHRSRGCIVVTCFPPDGIKDADDLLRQCGSEAVRETIITALKERVWESSLSDVKQLAPPPPHSRMRRSC